ncbi:MAG TPA: diadenylate cyclase CdaA [Deltaproteobacteria bacterium]|nr:diadenylate cyclase CdaA [Deltaproteobacteria bacterium]
MPDMLDNLTLFDICDILIIAVLVYVFARFLRREVATRLLILLLIFFTIFYASHFSGLVSTALLFDSIYSSALILIVVILQSDIRRAFLSLGRRKQPDDSSRDDDGNTIEELIKAVQALSAKQIGALIVIERHISLDHLVEIGTEIDAKVTSELLNSIFLPYSPIHDGAVIIQQGKITKAGCLLPLSSNPDIAKSFGTRHRAALGLTELVDALVLVVSEETGKISMVHDSKINYDVDASEMRRMLRKPLEIKRRTSGGQ